MLAVYSLLWNTVSVLWSTCRDSVSCTHLWHTSDVVLWCPCAALWWSIRACRPPTPTMACICNVILSWGWKSCTTRLRLTYFTLTELSSVAWVFPWKKNVREHFCSSASQTGLRPWYFLHATCVPRIDWPVFQPQTAHTPSQGQL